MVIYVIKNSGERDVFDKSKIIQSCLRAGARLEDAEKIADEVEKKIYDGIRTRDVMKLVKENLRKLKLHPVYVRYPLKDALFKLNPDNYEFEYYIANLFRYLGYEAQRSLLPKLRGFCVDHEIDVFLLKDGKAGFVEVKHRSREDKYVHLDVVMYHYARFLDFVKGYKEGKVNFKGKPDSCWVVTNTKFTYHAIKYSQCYGIKLLGWNFPYDNGINAIIERYKAYPLTLFNIKSYIREILFEKYGVIDANDLYNMDKEVLKKYLKKDYNSVIKKLYMVMEEPSLKK